MLLTKTPKKKQTKDGWISFNFDLTVISLTRDEAARLVRQLAVKLAEHPANIPGAHNAEEFLVGLHEEERAVFQVLSERDFIKMRQEERDEKKT